jgi:hypothetical protein
LKPKAHLKINSSLLPTSGNWPHSSTPVGCKAKVLICNKAGEYLAAYQITINDSDASGRAELGCVYVVSEVLSSMSKNSGSGGMKS